MSVDIHALSGAYAVDAVDEFERAQFERHLADCPSCRAEVDSLQAAVTLLPEVSTLQPPASLRASVLAGVQTVRPLPPVLVAASERGRATRRRFPALVAAAVALIAIGGAGSTVWHNAADDPAVQGTDVAGELAQASDAQVFAKDLKSGAHLEVVTSHDLDRAVITAAGLPELPTGRVYQLWLNQDGNMVPAGYLDDPAAPTVLHGDVDSATSANITVEDAEGATEPDLSNFVGAVDLEQA